jgi:uncharacterized membrane protein YkvA (DUF1232 family)
VRGGGKECGVRAIPGRIYHASLSLLGSRSTAVRRFRKMEDIVGTGLMQTHRLKKRLILTTATLKTRAGNLFRQFRTLLRALVHPRVPWYAKFVCACAALYVVSPIQLIPNFIPIIGQLDDVLVISMSLKLLKRSVSLTVLDECQRGSRSPLATAVPSNPPISASPALRSEASPLSSCK